MTTLTTEPTAAPGQTAAVVVYSKPACVQCDATKRWLTKRGIEYTAVDVSQDATAREHVTGELKHSRVPVVVVSRGGETYHWSGFDPDLLAQHLA